MTLTRALRRSLLAALCAFPLLLSSPAIAQTRETNLQDISRQMFREGNERFILVEALKDGLIPEGGKYQLQYTNEVVKINGKAVPAKYQKHYNSLLKKFSMMESQRRGSDYKVTAMHGNALKMRDVVNPTSDFRTTTVSAAQN